MKNKKLFQIIIISLVAVWIFSVSLMVGFSKVKKQRNELPPLTPQIEDSTSNQSTTASTTQASPDVTIDGNLVTALVTTMPPTSAQESSDSQQPTAVPEKKLPSTKKEVIDAYLNAVNKLKATPNFKLVKTEDLRTAVDEMSPSSVKGIVSKVIASNTDTTPVTYVFSNGIDSATGISQNYVLPPIGANAQLSESIVTKARSASNSDGGYTLYITLGKEIQTLSTPAPNYSTVMKVLNPDDMGLPSSAKIDSYTVIYDDSTIEARFDKDDRLTYIEHFISVTDSQGNGSLVVPVSISGHGSCTVTYQITY